MLDVRITQANNRSLAGEIIGDVPDVPRPQVVAPPRKKPALRLPIVEP